MGRPKKQTEKVEAVEVMDATVAQTSAKVPDAVLGQDANFKMLEIAVKTNNPVLLVGETGTGKTSLVRALAHKYGKEFVRVNLNGQTSIDEFVGKFLIQNKQTVWVDGILIQAMKSGAHLLLDEINAALPEILFVLHSLLDDDKYVRLIEKNGEIVRPHADFRLFATMNPFDEYVGTKELNKAFMSRFTIVLDVEYPNPKDEMKIVGDRTGANSGDVAIMVEFANRAREEKRKENIYYTCSTRDLLYWAFVTTQGVSLKDAFKVTILNKANKADRPALIKIFDEVTKQVSNLLKEYEATDMESLLKSIEQMANDTAQEKKNVQQAAQHYQMQRNKLEDEYKKREGDLKKAYDNKVKQIEDEKQDLKRNALKEAMEAIQNQLMNNQSSQTKQSGSSASGEAGQSQPGTSGSMESMQQTLEAAEEAADVVKGASQFLNETFGKNGIEPKKGWYETEEEGGLEQMVKGLEAIGIKPVVNVQNGVDQGITAGPGNGKRKEAHSNSFEGAVANKKEDF